MDDEERGPASFAVLDDATSDALIHHQNDSAGVCDTQQRSTDDPKERNNAMSDQLPRNIAIEEFTESVFGAVLRALDTRQLAIDERKEQSKFIPGPIIYGIFLDIQQIGLPQIQGARTRSIEGVELPDSGTSGP